MIKKEMIAMLLAGGQGSRLGVLTEKVAKPAVAFGGKYRIIDFPLSNCINSGIDTVGVLTQYQPLRLNTHIGIGIPWDLDRNEGGVTVLPPYEKSTSSEWYTGTANAIFQNMDYMEQYNPDYVLILSGDHIYKMDYEVMLDFHKANKADVTIACMPVPMEEASRFGIMVTDDMGRITEFEEKPEHPSSNLASMGIYIFSWPALKEALISLKNQNGCDFGKHILPYCKEKGERLFAYEYNGYWKDVGTLGSYWEANMELIDIDSIQPDISNVYATEPGTYEVNYTFNDSKGEQRTATVKCEVKPELASHVTGMQNLTIDKGNAIPTDAGCSFDEYVDSVTLNTEDVDNEEAGTYDISYTILGANGEMKTVDGYTCTVNEVAPPTPTPTPSPTPTPTPEPEEEKPEDKENTDGEIITGEGTESEQTDAEETPAPADNTVGNVEVQNNVVETGDENNIAAIVAVIVICLGAAGGILVYKKKKDTKSK